MKGVLLVDDDPTVLKFVASILRKEAIETVAATSGEEALRLVDEQEPAAVVLDVGLPDMSGKEVLARLRRDRPGLPVVMLSGEDAVDIVVECMKLGAVDYVHKPCDPNRLVASVRNARTQGLLRARVDEFASELRATAGVGAILGGAPATARTRELVAHAARSDMTVLLEGESGVGKEVAARAIHAESSRGSGPLVVVNCGAIAESLAESELFGHERGAFTGATGTRRGLFEQADGGTILLDEIGELRLELQPKLLRVLEDRRVQRVGGAAPRPVDVRVIAATNRDLRAEVAKRGFREDLYFRLAAFPIRIPPLRERREDVMLLADAFLARAAARHRSEVRGFTADARRALEAYAWPGNVRELEHVIARATLIEEGPAVSLSSLPDGVVAALESPTPAPLAPAPPAPAPQPGVDPRSAIIPFDDEERRIVHRALELTGWSVDEAARRLGIGRTTIYRKIERYGLTPPPRRG